MSGDSKISQLPTATPTTGTEVVPVVQGGQTVQVPINQLLAPSYGASAVGSNDGAGGTLWTTVAGFITKILSSAGASVVGYDGGTAQNVLDESKPLASYAALRTYAGTANGIRITGVLGTAQPQGIAGQFEYDSTDTTSGALFTGSTAPIPTPAAPALSSAAGGVLAATTYYVKVTYVTAAGETVASAESSLAVLINNVLVVTSPAAQAGATGYNVYVSTTTNTETKQNATPINIGTNWTEPVGGLIAGSALPASGTAGSVLTASSITNGAFVLGQAVNRPDTGATVGYIIAQLTGVSGSTGTYTLSAAATVASMILHADNGGTIILDGIGRRFKRQFSGPVSLSWFMTQAELDDANNDTMLYDHTNALQAFVNVVVAKQCSGYLNARNPHITRPIVMNGGVVYPPGSGQAYHIYGDGPTGTSISELNTGKVKGARTNPVANLLDFSSQAGPSVIIEKLSLNGPEQTVGGAAGVYGGNGAYFSSSNGILFRDVWCRGLTNGVLKTNTSSYISLDYCTFEFNSTGINFTDNVECFVTNTNYYQNLTDVSLSGDCTLGRFLDSLHVQPVYFAYALNACRGAKVDNVEVRQDYATFLPDVIKLTNTSVDNVFNNIVARNVGRVLVSLSTTCTGNVFNELYATLGTTAVGAFAPPAGTLAAAIEVGVGCTGNTFKGLKADGCASGLVDAANSNSYIYLEIKNSTTAAVTLSATDNTIIDGLRLSGNAADWSTSGIGTLWLDRCNSATLPPNVARLGSLRVAAAGRVFYSAGATPAALAHLVGDRYINTTPTDGQPDEQVCISAGTPGTWVPTVLRDRPTTSGDVDVTLTPLVSNTTLIVNAPLTAARAVNLSTTNANAGFKFKIVRTAASTGAFNLNVGTGPLKALTPGTWCTVMYVGAAFVLIDNGAL